MLFFLNFNFLLKNYIISKTQQKQFNLSMNDQNRGFQNQPEQQKVRSIIEIQEANPICQKNISAESSKVNLKMIQIPKSLQHYTHIPFRLNIQSQSSESDEEFDQEKQHYSPFTQIYDKQQLVYQRFNNSQFNKINSVVYFSGAFIQRQLLLNFSKESSNSLVDILQEDFIINNQDLPQLNIQPFGKRILLFDSDFQSGNLFAVYKISQRQYDLIMQNDTNSCGNNQWFYFSVKNLIVGAQYTFNIVNFTKNDSLFNYGMTPVAFSELTMKKNNLGWHKIGRDVIYKRSQIHKEKSKRFYYKLSFKMNWKQSNDKVYIAHSYPYTYSKLLEKIQSITLKHLNTVTRVTIGTTLSKKNIQVIIITQRNSSKKKDIKKAIIIMARQHPGEAQGSFVCDGFMDALLHKSKQGDFMRKNYVVYVIPMVNPDGVIFGHYRTNLAGKDLNRKWDSTERQLNCPQVTSIKAFLASISKEREIRFIVDFHGHSKKLNSFFYGNPDPEHPEHVRIFPYICSKLSSAVQYQDCTFAAEQYKRKAARVYLSYLYKQIQVYTFQSSFYGYFKSGKKQQFTPKQYEGLGETILFGLSITLEYQDFMPQKLKQNLYTKSLQELKSNRNLLQMGNRNQSGSQSKPQEGQIAQLPEMILNQKKSIKLIKYSQKKKGIQLKDLKEIIRPTRNLKLLEIGRVNSVLPDRYHLGLQPINKKQQRKYFSRSFQILKIHNECQTEGDQIINEYRNRQIEEYQNLSHSIKVQNVNKQKNSNSLIKSITRNNNIILRIDLSNEKFKPIKYQTQEKQLFNAYSQTIVSFSKINKYERIRSSQLFPTVKSSNIDKKLIQPYYKKYQNGKMQMKQKETQIFLNGIAQRYILEKGAKMRQNTAKYIDRSLSIKKKELYQKF